MPKKDLYILSHKQCKTEFAPKETVRFNRHWRAPKDCQWQDMLSGVCPKCKAEVRGWVAIDYLGNPYEYTSINPDKFSWWDDRLKVDKAHTPKAEDHNIVTGSIYDMKSGKWRYSEKIPVYG